jgi:peptidoglycan/LPS O-acetylase OafA/YrhL
VRPAPPTDVPAGIRRGSRYLPELESLRGLAIALVFAFHADGVTLRPLLNRHHRSPLPPLSFVWSGHTGVTLFFILSAFLLALPFLDQAYGGSRVRWGTFWARRALRILPLYYFAVLVGAIATAGAWAGLQRALPYFAFVNSDPFRVTPMPPFSDVWWSLAVEMQFYLLLPLVAVAFGRSLAVTWALLVTWTAAYAAVAGGFLWPTLDGWIRAQSVIGRSPAFVLGILAAWLYRRHGEALRSRFAASPALRGGGADLLLLLVLFTLGLLLRWSTYWGFLSLEPTGWFVWHVPESLLWAVVMLIVLLCPLRTRALFCNPVFARLGVLSYSIYMLHMPLLVYTMHALRRAVPTTEVGWGPITTTWFAATALLCVGLSMATYRYVERPFLVRKASLGGARGPAAARAA